MVVLKIYSIIYIVINLLAMGMIAKRNPEDGTNIKFLLFSLPVYIYLVIK